MACRRVCHFVLCSPRYCCLDFRGSADSTTGSRAAMHPHPGVAGGRVRRLVLSRPGDCLLHLVHSTAHASSGGQVCRVTVCANGPAARRSSRWVRQLVLGGTGYLFLHCVDRASQCHLVHVSQVL